jgi:hypothetical protein
MGKIRNPAYPRKQGAATGRVYRVTLTVEYRIDERPDPGDPIRDDLLAFFDGLARAPLDIEVLGCSFANKETGDALHG